MADKTRPRAGTILTVDLLDPKLKKRVQTAAKKALPAAGSGAVSQWVRQVLLEALGKKK